MSFSPRSEKLALGVLDGTIRVLETGKAGNKGRKIFRLEGPRQPVCSVTFAPDGETLGAAGLDGTIRLINADTGKEIQRFGANKDGGEDRRRRQSSRQRGFIHKGTAGRSVGWSCHRAGQFPPTGSFPVTRAGRDRPRPRMVLQTTYRWRATMWWAQTPYRRHSDAFFADVVAAAWAFISCAIIE